LSVHGRKLIWEGGGTAIMTEAARTVENVSLNWSSKILPALLDHFNALLHVFDIFETSSTTRPLATMFGVIISGRPILAEPQAISQTQFAFTIPSAPSFSHIVVFLLPGTTLPDGTAAAVYAQLPGSTDFKLLGAIANEKPSAIFKVNNKAGGPAGGGIGNDDAMVDEGAPALADGVVPNLALGISVEPAAQVAANLEQKKAQEAAAMPTTGLEIVRRAPNAATTKVLAQRIIKNCYDFLTSWGSGDTVPLKAFQAWWTKFEHKIEMDPEFLERSDGN
jgi:hypothetical protein